MRTLTDRLLVLADQHHLQAVGQLADLVRRERHRLGRQRPRRTLARPAQARRPALPGREADARTITRDGGDERRLHERGTLDGSWPAFPAALRHDVHHQARSPA